jgi:hypothetical protein
MRHNFLIKFLKTIFLSHCTKEKKTNFILLHEGKKRRKKHNFIMQKKKKLKKTRKKFCYDK